MVFVVDGLLNAFRMAWEVWWALVLGFLLSGIVQAWVPRSRLQSALGGAGETVEKAGDLGPALRRAFDAGVPYLVNVLTDPADAYPRSSNLA